MTIPPAHTLTVSAGRSLGFDDLGPRDGHPVLFFHGTPASRVNWRFFAAGALLEDLGLRVLAVDRPGIGASSGQPSRTHRTWAEDMEALLDGLSLPRAAVLAHSGGGPYALACAAHLPERISAAAVVAGSPPDYTAALSEGTNADSRRFLELCATRPRMARAMLRMMKAMLRFAPDRMLAQSASVLPSADRQVMDDPAMRRAFFDMMSVALAQGPAGTQQDGALMHGPWTLPLDRIRCPVHLHYGSEDRNVPVAVGAHFRDRIATATLTTHAGEGHLSVMVRHGERILRELAAAA